ncbi:hypothetical protein TNCV_3205061 [Trichonephila clavipes]|nr:hypothetical protein TNCV_3205061 [Trichonephila clavipes]
MRRTGFEGPDWRRRHKRALDKYIDHPGLETSATSAKDISCHKKKYLDCPGLETSATPANDISCHKKKNLDYPGLETSATPANDNSCHKKKYLDHPGLKRIPKIGNKVSFLVYKEFLK